jgi:cell division protein FtsB
MNRLTRIRANFSSHLFVIAGLALCAYFSYHAVYGERSYASLIALDSKVEQKQQELADITQEREVLESDVKMMRPDSLSKDLLEERVRAVLGYKKPDEYVIIRN